MSPLESLWPRGPADAELRRERWLRARGIEVGHVVRVLPGTPHTPEEVLYLTPSGEPETAIIADDWSVMIDAGW